MCAHPSTVSLPCEYSRDLLHSRPTLCSLLMRVILRVRTNTKPLRGEKGTAFSQEFFNYHLFCLFSPRASALLGLPRKDSQPGAPRKDACLTP